MKLFRHLLPVLLLFAISGLLVAEEICVQSGPYEAVFSERGVLLDLRKDGVGMLDNSPEGSAWTLAYKDGEFTSLQYTEAPFVSYGGSSLIGCFWLLGMALSAGGEREIQNSINNQSEDVS